MWQVLILFVQKSINKLLTVDHTIMSMSFKELALILTLLPAFLACEKEKNLNVANQSSSFLQKKFFVSKEQAMALVETLQRNKRTTETNGKEIGDIATFTDRAGIAIFYVINFKDNKGHLLLSADKRMKPVLAFSDSGIFDLETDNPGIQLWKNFIAEHAVGIRGKTEASIDIVNEWRQFEIGQGAGFKTTDQPVWTPEASCEYFATHPIPPNVTIQHLTYNVAHWLQGKGYNAHCPNGIVVPNCTKSGIFPCGKALVGCGPLAIGQVLKFHHKSVTVEGTNYTEAMLNGMPMTHSGDCPPPDNTGNGNLSHLLRDIGKATGATYNTVVPALGVPMSGSGCQTWMEPGKTDDFFVARGFTSYDLDFFNSANQTAIKNQLLAQRPVIVYGSNCSACLSNMHMWVIDGIQDLHAIYQDQNGYCYEYTTYYYQMNWGWANSVQNDTWFAYDNIVGDGILYNSANMKAYIIIPN
ncbi:MAG: hypothetical protein BGO21_15820 [Dyadobacter sp. 50-39]|nr:MAG: hypothetical protein BGO21_15820 [Dyadobacter sp. 50-39]